MNNRGVAATACRSPPLLHKLSEVMLFSYRPAPSKPVVTGRYRIHTQRCRIQRARCSTPSLGITTYTKPMTPSPNPVAILVRLILYLVPSPAIACAFHRPVRPAFVLVSFSVRPDFLSVASRYPVIRHGSFRIGAHADPARAQSGCMPFGQYR